MGGGNIVLKCVLGLTVLLSAYGKPDEDIPYLTKIVEGIYAKEVEGNVVYDTVVPLVFEFDVPSWTRNDTIIPRSQNCTNANFTASSTCPILYYLPEMQSRFSSYLEQSQPLGSLFDASEVGKDARIEFDCDTIDSHFNGNLFYAQETIDEYLEDLTRCPAKEIYRVPKARNYNYNISGIYMQMRQGFYTHFWLAIYDGRTDAALWSNAIKVLNSLAFNNFYMESNRWKLAISDCKAGRVPSSLIDKDVLKATLNETFNLVSKKFLPSLHLKELPTYFSAPLTDCTFTDKNTFLVRILVPVQDRNSGSSYTVSKLSTAPFIKHDSSENRTLLCEIRTSNNYVLVDQLRNIGYGTECTGKGLCKTPGWLNGLKVDSCASAVIAKSYKDIVRYCDLHCEEISPWQSAPVARQIDTDKFVLAMNPHSSTTAILRCPGSKDRDLRSVEVGAVQIRLSCTCRIHSSSSTDVIKVTTCNPAANSGEPLVFQIVPLHWINEKRLNTLDSTKPRDMSFRSSGLVLRTTSTKYSNAIDANAIRADKVSGSGNGDTSGTNGAFLFFSYLLTLIVAGAVLFLYYKLKKLQNISGFSGQQVAYIHSNAPLLENEEHDNYNHNRF